MSKTLQIWLIKVTIWPSSTGLRQACPEGVFVSLTPGDLCLWAGVMFVRKGPYAPAILRFQVSFPDTYPSLPPLVTFSTDMFHPLITPLTTYTYTTDIQDNGTVSATDDERLPPGGFSLRHGFPAWFGRGSNRTHQASSASTDPATRIGSERRASSLFSSGVVSTYDVLRYIRSTFDDDAVLDAVPLEAAGNPGAWHAWRAHRGGARDAAGASVARNPDEWNWDGVWEERSQRNIKASLSEPVLYGGAAADDVINFTNMEQDELEAAKANLLGTVGPSRSS